MSRTDYNMTTRWRIPGEIDVVAAILADPTSLAEWWPALYLKSTPIPATESWAISCKGWLPQTLKWTLRLVEIDMPHTIVMEGSGDLEARGEIHLAQEGADVVVVTTWHSHRGRTIARAMSGAFRPLFIANYRWAMARGEESLRLEVARRTAANDVQLAAIPPPPGPVSPSAAWSMFAVVCISLIVPGSLLMRVVRPPSADTDARAAHDKQ